MKTRSNDRSPAPTSNEGTPSIVGLESAGPADVPLIEPKTWAQFANLGTLLAGVAIIFAVGIASVNWKQAGKEMIHYTDGFHAPQGAGDAYYIRQDKKFHYLDVPSEDMTVQVPNYYYEWANCHSGGYECSPAALEHAFWTRLYSGNLPSGQEVKSVLRKWRRTLTKHAQEAGASAEEAVEIADDALRSSYGRAVEFEQEVEDWVKQHSEHFQEQKEHMATELDSAKQRLAYRMGWYSALPWYKRWAASTTDWLGENIPYAAWMLPEPRRSWVLAKRATDQKAQQAQNIAQQAAERARSAVSSASDMAESAADTIKEEAAEVSDQANAMWKSTSEHLPSGKFIKTWVNNAKQDLAELLPSKRAVKRNSNEAIQAAQQQLRDLQAQIMELQAGM